MRVSLKAWQLQAKATLAVGCDCVSGLWSTKRAVWERAKWGEVVAPRIMEKLRIALLTRHLPSADGL